MKQILLVLLTIFFFLGCAPKKVVTVPKKEVKEEIKVEIEQPVVQPVIKQETMVEDKVFKVAIIFPSKIVGKYANSTINTIMGYLLYKNEKFEIEAFDTINQDLESMQKNFNEIAQKGYTNVIALYPKSALKNLYSISATNKMQLYLPLIHKKDSPYRGHNFIYGGISYDAQLAKLLTLSNGDNAMFYEESSLGRKLKFAYDNLVPKSFPTKSIRRIDTKYKRLVEDEALNGKALMLNTPIIKSSIILSQLRAHEITPNIILSTQLNYNPLLVSLTQFEDRVNFITANSIEKTDDVLTENLALLDAEIGYNWVNYASLVGINHFFSWNKDGLIKNYIANNQVQYKVHLYNSTAYGFQKINLE